MTKTRQLEMRSSATFLLPRSAERSWGRLDRETGVLYLLCFVDVGLILLNVLFLLGYLSDDRFCLNRDRGFAECFQYGKEIFCSGILFAIAFRQRSMLVAVFATFFGYMFLDDSIRLHERIGGNLIGRALPLKDLDSAYHAGQFVYAVIASICLVLAIGCCWRRADRLSRKVAGGLIVCLAAFGIASIGVDSIHGLLTPSWLHPAMVVLEETGEHFAITATVWWSVKQALLKPQPE